MRIGSPQNDERHMWVSAEVQPNVRYRCPCCQYPTLKDRGQFSHCELCNWEDDGANDPHADEVWGGPNLWYSLPHAHRNFVDHLNMYDEDDPFCDDDNHVVKDAKRGLITIFDAIENEPGEATSEILWRDVLDAERMLRKEYDKRFSDRAWFEERGRRYLEHREVKQTRLSRAAREVHRRLASATST